MAEVDPIGPLVVVGLMLGLRPGELCGLRWRDVDLDGGTLHVRQSRKRERGPDGRDVLSFGEPKTAKSRRSLTMPAPVVAALQRQRALQARARLVVGAAWLDHDLVFANAIGAPIDPSNLRRAFARLTKRAGLGAWPVGAAVAPMEAMFGEG